MRSIITICSVLAVAFAIGSPAVAQQKTVKACQQEWRANKAANQAKGITEKAYVEQCRSGNTAAVAPAPAATQSSPAATQPSPTASSPRTRPSRATNAAAPRETTPLGANEFTSETQAKAHCPSDTVVWVNLRSHIYHFEGSRSFGKTKSGAFMCEKDANSAGMRPAKNEKQPG